MPQFVRLNQAIPSLGDSRSRAYAAMASGLLPRPVKTGTRAAALLEHEVQTIVAARAAGLRDEAMRKVVADLEALRVDLAGRTDAALAETTASIVRKHSAKGSR